MLCCKTNLLSKPCTEFHKKGEKGQKKEKRKKIYVLSPIHNCVNEILEKTKKKKDILKCELNEIWSVYSEGAHTGSWNKGIRNNNEVSNL